MDRVQEWEQEAFKEIEEMARTQKWMPATQWGESHPLQSSCCLYRVGGGVCMGFTVCDDLWGGFMATPYGVQHTCVHHGI